MDPKNRSPWAFLLEGKIEGLDELAEAAKKSGKFDYDAKVAGMRAVDRYTLEFRLKDTDYIFPYVVAHVPFGAVAREVVEAYSDDAQAHPVGTGPYVLKQWSRAAKIVLEANPDYRGFTWDFAVADPAWDDALVKAMRGKKMPQIGRVEISIIEEEQSRWLAFNQKELDILNLPAAFRPEVFDADNRIKAKWTEQGVSLFKAIDPDITYTFFNFRDPLVGGFSKEKIALRRAIIMGYNLEEEIRVVRKHQAVAARNADPRRRGRPRPELSHHQSLRPRARQQAARLLQVHARQGRLPHAARRQAARASGRRTARRRSSGSSPSCGRSRWTRSASGWNSRSASSPSTSRRPRPAS